MVIEGVNAGRGVQVQNAAPVSTGKTVENTDVTAVKSETGSAAPKAENYSKTAESGEKNAAAQGKEGENISLSEQLSNEQLKKVIEQFNKKIGNSEAIFGVHEETNRVTIKIIDKDTKETIKELPPEKTLDMIARVWEMAGILVDEKR